MNAIKYIKSETISPNTERYITRNRYFGGKDGRGTNALFAVAMPVKPQNWYKRAKLAGVK